MKIMEKLARDTVDAIWLQKPVAPDATALLGAIGFNAEQQADIIALCNKHEFELEKFVHRAVEHYCDYWSEMDLVPPPANFEGHAPSFAPPQSVFRPEDSPHV